MSFLILFLALSALCLLQTAAGGSCVASCIATCMYEVVHDTPSISSWPCSANSTYVCHGGVAQPSTAFFQGAIPVCTASCLIGSTVCTQVIAANRQDCGDYYYGSKTYVLDTKCDPNSTTAACVFPAATVDVVATATLTC